MVVKKRYGTKMDVDFTILLLKYSIPKLIPICDILCLEGLDIKLYFINDPQSYDFAFPLFSMYNIGLCKAIPSGGMLGEYIHMLSTNISFPILYNFCVLMAFQDSNKDESKIYLNNTFFKRELIDSFRKACSKSSSFDSILEEIRYYSGYNFKLGCIIHDNNIQLCGED